MELSRAGLAKPQGAKQGKIGIFRSEDAAF
jgi:hypothetical protein